MLCVRVYIFSLAHSLALSVIDTAPASPECLGVAMQDKSYIFTSDTVQSPTATQVMSPECLAVAMQLKSCVSSYMMRGATHGAFLFNPEMLAALSARLNSHYHIISTTDKSLGHLAPVARRAQSDAR